ncbi:MAG: hypothetical protein FJ164_08925 [Gammaproteobacteria bacterium]|nr:hypothetical protein [Gammaproteobacteria bacterium]
MVNLLQISLQGDEVFAIKSKLVQHSTVNSINSSLGMSAHVDRRPQMTKTLSLAMRAALVAGVVGLMAGCSNVTPEQLSAVEAKASEALSKAGAASANADKAMKAAADAAAAAQAAQAAADAAQACCNDNKSRLDSMFEKAMRK